MCSNTFVSYCMLLSSNEIIKIYVEPFLKFYTARSKPHVIRTIYWKRQRLNANQPRRYSSDIFIIQWHTDVQRNAVWPNRKWRWLVLRVHAVSAFQLVPLSWHQMRNRMSSQAGAARQCVRHARYRQYPPIRFSSLFRSPGDRTPTPHYRLHRFTILPRLQHNRVFITTSTQRRAPLSSFFFSLSFFRFYDEQWDLQWTPPEIASVFFTRTVTAYALRTSLSVFFCLFFAAFVSRVKLIRSVVQPAAWTDFNLICKVLVNSDLL